nr:MAG TPA: hypothetical protein [Caudoviricetes sp.]
MPSGSCIFSASFTVPNFCVEACCASSVPLIVTLLRTVLPSTLRSPSLSILL